MLIPPVDRYASVVAFSQSLLGRLVLLTIFAAGLWLHGRDWWLEAIVILAAMSFLPAWRRHLLLVGMLYWLWRWTPFNWGAVMELARNHDLYGQVDWAIFKIATIAMVLAFCAGFYALALRFRDHAPWDRPLRLLLVAYVALMVIASYAPLSARSDLYLWAFLVVLGKYIWFLAYSLLDIHSKQRSAYGWQLGHYHPFWMGAQATPVPFAKGAAYLRKIEARDRETLAITQLKAIKLMYWALILRAARAVYQGFVYTGTVTLGGWSIDVPFTLSAPSFGDVFSASVVGVPAPWHANWLALVARFLLDLLSVAIWGHVMIAVCRMAGYRALRNTYRPLSSATIAEFWNRYYYYFKELMVECFFYPAYLRYFRNRPRLRIFFATLAAAGFGNMLFHFLRDGSYIVSMGVWDAFAAFRVYLVYAALLGTAIGFSQLRHQGRRLQRDSLRTRVLAPISVLAFYCVLSVFNDPDRSVAMMEYFRFMAHLVPGI